MARELCRRINCGKFVTPGYAFCLKHLEQIREKRQAATVQRVKPKKAEPKATPPLPNAMLDILDKAATNRRARILELRDEIYALEKTAHLIRKA